MSKPSLTGAPLLSRGQTFFTTVVGDTAALAKHWCRAAPQFPHPPSSGKSGQFFEEPSQETLEGQAPHRSGALCHLHKLLFL